MTPVRLTLMRDGSCRQFERIARRSGRWRMVDFEAMFALIEHPSAGCILFDTGYGGRFAEATQRFPARLYRWLTPVKTHSPTAVQQTKGPVSRVIASHFHADHIGGLQDFPEARIHCSCLGWNKVRRYSEFQAVRHGFLAKLVPSDFAARAVFVEDAQRVTLPEELAPFSVGYDLLGDGSLLAVELPGHAIGQFGIVLREENGRLTFLIADGAWSRTAIRENSPPARIVGTLGDWRAILQTLGMLHKLHRRSPQVRLIPSHCPEIWQD
jgi:glyoxylase-like metal-dependent hydrolase (beta-lactamase superfamily II)